MRATVREEEFSAYVLARRPHLQRSAYLLCGDAHLAEDLVQIALAKLYAAWPRVSRADSPDAYAHRVLVNAHLDERRRPWRRERPVDAVDERGAGGRTLEEAEVEHDVLLAALRDLPAGQRRVVVLRHYWQLSVAEAAAMLGVSPGTVKSQTSLALARLQTALAASAEGTTTTNRRGHR